MDLDALGKLLEYYKPPFIEEITRTSGFSNRMAAEAFGHPWDEIDPEFWRWRALERVPEESDLCPWVRSKF